MSWAYYASQAPVPTAEISLVAFALVLGIGAYFDYKSNMVPDLVSAGIWLAGIMAFFVNPIAIFILPLAFGLIFGGCAAIKHLTDIEMMGWADVLTLPPFLAMMGARAADVGSVWLVVFAALAFSVPAILAYKDKDKLPLLAWMFGAYVVSFAL